MRSGIPMTYVTCEIGDVNHFLLSVHNTPNSASSQSVICCLVSMLHTQQCTKSHLVKLKRSYIFKLFLSLLNLIHSWNNQTLISQKCFISRCLKKLFVFMCRGRNGVQIQFPIIILKILLKLPIWSKLLSNYYMKTINQSVIKCSPLIVEY